MTTEFKREWHIYAQGPDNQKSVMMVDEQIAKFWKKRGLEVKEARPGSYRNAPRTLPPISLMSAC